MKVIDDVKASATYSKLQSSLQVEDEATFQSSMQHPCLVPCLHAFRDVHSVHLAWEYLQGSDTKDYVIREGSFPRHVVHTFFAQVLSGLVFMHARCLVHRDAKLGKNPQDRSGHLQMQAWGFWFYTARPDLLGLPYPLWHSDLHGS